MQNTRHPLLVLLAGLAMAGACGPSEAPEPGTEPPLPDAQAWEAQTPLVPGVQQWRDKHEVDYLRDWVSIAGLHFLDDGVLTVGSDQNSDIVVGHVPSTIGRLIIEGDAVRYEPAAGIEVMQEEAPVTGPVAMKAAGEAPAPEVVVGAVRLVVHESGNRLALRVRDPDGEPARAFAGFSWFPIDPSYRVVGRFVPDATPRELPVLNTFDDVDTYRTEGVIEFELQGELLRLRPFTTRPNRFYIVFRDASAGEETYEVARFLYADLLADGTTVLDFNMSYNPPCAFNLYTTCPIPMQENRLPVRILAGERAYVGESPHGGG
jgi:uncharacterized protein (DUF1684 family)